MTLPPVRHVVLVGLMGAGKTSVGRELARGLGWPHVDNDATLGERTGGTAREVEREVGAQRLHALEAEQLLDALASPTPSVVSAAASTIEDGPCRQALSAPDIFVVWLRAPASALAARARRSRHRPELGADLDALLRDQIEVRGPLFGSVADLVVDVSTGSPRPHAAQIQAAIAAQVSR